MLISVPELADRLAGDSPVTVLDVRWRLSGPPARADYDQAHLPGAVFVDLDRDLADPPAGEGRHPMPDPDRFGAIMRSYGVSAGRPIVCYDDRDGTSAARCWWLLTYFGHPSVAVLDGGLSAWVEAGGEVTGGEVTGRAEAPRAPSPGDFVPRAGHLPLLDAAGAADLAGQGVLLDARAAERYRGEVEPIDPVAGHIPGARSAPALENLGADGQFLPASVLQERFGSLGVSPGVRVGVYCGSGVVAAQEVLALKLAGIEAGLYVGSWSDWVSDPTRPVDRG